MKDQPLPLGYVEQPNPPPRPKSTDAKIIERAARAAFEGDVRRWFGPEWAGDQDDVIADLGDALKRAHDGYDRCQVLSSLGWVGIDADLVEILDGDWVFGVERAAVAAWVEANIIRPKLAIGDAVDTPHGAGTITRIDESEARYVVRTAETKPPSLGFLIAYESCTPAVGLDAPAAAA